MSSSRTFRRVRVLPPRECFDAPTREILDLLATMSLDNRYRAAEVIRRFCARVPFRHLSPYARWAGRVRLAQAPHLVLRLPPRRSHVLFAPK